MKELTRKAIEIFAEMAAALEHNDSKVDVLLGTALQNSGLTTEEIVRKALDGDPDAHLFLCRQAGGALAQSQPMPRVLEAYAANFLLNQFYEGKRGKGRPPEWMKNYAIVHSLELLRNNGIPPMRSLATDTDEEPCGSLIVAEIFSNAGFRIGEAGVAKIYERHRHQILSLGNDVFPGLK